MKHRDRQPASHPNPLCDSALDSTADPMECVLKALPYLAKVEREVTLWNSPLPSDGARLIKAFLLSLHLRLRTSPLTAVRQVEIGYIKQKVCISAVGSGVTHFPIGWLYE